MSQSPSDLASEVTPRREAMRAMGAASAALLGVLGVNAAVDAKGKHKVKADKKGKRGKRGKPGKSGQDGASVSVVLGNVNSFDVDEDAANGADSFCPSGGIAISANFGISNTHCFMSNSAQSGDGAWQIAVVCPDGHSSEGNSVQAICLVIE